MKFTFKTIVLATSLLMSSLSFAQEDNMIKNLNKKLFDPSVTFLEIENEKISSRDFMEELMRQAKNKFYHGQIKVSEFKPIVDTTKNFFIDKILVVNYGLNNNVAIDQEELQKRYDGFKKRMGEKQWEATKIYNEIGIKNAYVYELVEKKVKDITINEDKLHSYYETNKEKLFTEPEKYDVSLILLKVSPSSPSEVWQDTYKEALQIVEKINSKKVSFEDVAMIQSADPSSKDGGRVGLVHKGILPSDVEEKMNVSAVDTLLPPVYTNEGISIIKFHGKKEPTVSSFEKVKPRLINLYTNEEKEKAFNNFKEGLRAKAKISVNPDVVSILESYEKISN